MQNEDVETGIKDALAKVPALLAPQGLSKCDIAEAVQVFLRSIQGKAGIAGGVGIRAAHGAISKWKKANGC